MGKKALLFIIIGVVVGALLAGAGVFFMIKNGGEKPVEEEVIEEVIPEFDKADGKRLTLEKVQIHLVQTSSKAVFLQADFTIIFKNPEALALAESMVPDIKDAIYGVFETKTAERKMHIDMYRHFITNKYKIIHAIDTYHLRII